MKEIIIVAMSYKNTGLSFEVMTSDIFYSQKTYICVSMVSEPIETVRLGFDKICLGLSTKYFYPDDVVICKRTVSGELYKMIEEKSYDFYDNGFPSVFLSEGHEQAQDLFFQILDIFK